MNPGLLSIVADDAQFLRVGRAFGAVPFHVGGAIRADQVVIEHGYADCLPVIGGGVWRDPDSQKTREAMR